jgi:cephalosporin hydroxylase
VPVQPKPKKIIVDFEAHCVTSEHDGGSATYPMNSPEAFSLTSKAWLRAGWDNKYVYSFAWLGRPFIQLPDDVLRIQELIFELKPDVVVETGVAHGGSLVFYASLFKAMGRGRVIGVDIEIRSHNRKAIEDHFLSSLITLIEGDSVSSSVVGQVKSLINPGETVLVLLDSNHTRDHVLAELKAYAPLVTPGSYVVAMDGIMGEVAGAPRTAPEWVWDNPTEAARLFVEANPDFVCKEPTLPFNEGNDLDRVTYWPGAYLKRLR